MAGKSPASHQSIASGKTAPTLIPTGKFAGKPEVSLSRTVTLIGSGAQSRLQLISSTVSKSHALIVNCDRGTYVRDLASRTKVLVNGAEQREAVLQTGDEVQFGKFAFTFREGPGRDVIDQDEDQRKVPAPDQAAVEVTGVDTPIPLNERCLLIGRRETCDIVISDEAVSTSHAVLFEMDGQRFVRDLGSRTGTFINGKQVHQGALNFGDTIRIGTIDLRYVPVEVAVEVADEQDELDELVRTDNLGTDAMAAAAAADIAGAQERAAARSMRAAEPAEDVNGEPDFELEAEPIPVEQEAPADSLEVIPLEGGPDEAAGAAEAAIPPEVAALQELTVDDLMEGEMSLDDIAPMTDERLARERELEVRHEPEPLAAGDMGLDETGEMEAVAEPELVAEVEAEPIAVEPELAEVDRAGGEEEFNVEEALGLAPQEPEPVVEAQPVEDVEPVAEVEAAVDEERPLDLAEPEIPRAPRIALGQAGPLEIAPLVDLSGPVAEPEPELQPVAQRDEPVEEIAEAPVEEPEIPVAAEVEEPAPLAEEQMPVEEEIPVAREPVSIEPEVEPAPVEVAAEEPAVADEPAEAPSAEKPEQWAEEEEAVEEVTEEAPAPVMAAPPPARVVAPSFERDEEQEEYEEEEEEEETQEAALTFDAPVAEALPTPEPLRMEEPVEAQAEPLDFSPPVDDAALAASVGDELDLNLDLAAVGDVTLPGIDGAIDELKLDFGADEAAGAAAGLGLAVPDLGLEPVAELPLAEPPAPKPKKKKPKKEPAPAPVVEAPPMPQEREAAPPRREEPAPPAPIEEAVAPVEKPREKPQPPRRGRHPRLAPAPAAQVPVDEAPAGVDEAPIPVDEAPAIAPAIPQEVIAPPIDEAPLETQAPHDVGPIEVIEETEPTSTREMDDALASVEVVEPAPPAMEEAEALTDTRFSRAVEEFTGDASTGPLIEEPAAPEFEAEAEAAPVSETPTFEAQRFEAPTFQPQADETIEVEGEVEFEPPQVAEFDTMEAPGEEELGQTLEPPATSRAPMLEEPSTQRPLDEDSLGSILDEGPAGEEIAPPPAGDPMAGFASFNTLARELDLNEPVVEGLPSLEPGAHEKFQAHVDAEHDWAGSSLEDVLNEALGPVEAKPPAAAERELPTPQPEPLAEPILDEPAPVDILGPEREEPLVDETPATVDVDELGDIEIEAQAEPVAEAPKPAPAAPAPQPPAQRPQAPAAGILNWGANQEHFLGGMPLSLGDLVPGPRTPPLVAGTPGARPAPAGQPGPVQPPQPVGEEPISETPAAPRIAPGAGEDVAPPAGAPPRQAPAPGERPRLIQPTPQQRKRPAPKPKAPTGMGLVSPPAQKAEPKQVQTGFDGLAVGPVGPARQVDVFSQLPTPLTGGRDPFGGGAGAAGGAGAPPADDVFNRGRGGQQPKRNLRRQDQAQSSGQEQWDPNQPAPAEHGESSIPPTPPEAPPPKKKRRWFGLKSLFILMVLCMGATAGGIWYGLPQRSLITGTLKFSNNYKKLSELEKRKLERDQRELLLDEQTRRDARALLVGIKRDAEAGFLESPLEYAKLLQGSKFDLEAGLFNVNYLGTDEADDRARMQALLRALYNGSKSSVGEVEKLREAVSNLQRAVEAKRKEVEGYQQQSEKIRLAAESRPDAGEQTRVESEATRLEGEYREAILAVAKLQADVDRLQGKPVSTAPAIAPAMKGVATSAPIVDTTLAQYENDLNKLSQRVTTVKNIRSQKAAEARKALDAAAEAFQKQIEQAQTAIKDNPELSKYFTSARQLQDSMRDLTEQYLHRQQDQYSKLSELKSRMDEKMTARRDDALKNDPKLKEYLDQKAIKTRQYNAAVGQNYTKEAGELKADLDLLEQMIKARQTQLGDDAFYADAIAQLQKIIESTQRGIEDDKRETTRVLDQLQLAFSKQQPAKETLPADQKKLAGELEQRLEKLAQARRAYTEAAELANAQADEEIRQMEVNATALSEKISSRKRQVAAERDGDYGILDAGERQQTLRQKQEQLAKALAMKDMATNAHNAAQVKLADVRARLTAAREAGAKLDELTKMKDQASREYDQLDGQLQLKNRLLAGRAEPLEPTAANVSAEPQENKRPIYTLAATGGVAALFVVLMLMNAGGGGGRQVAPPGYPVMPQAQEYSQEDYSPEQQEEYAQAEYQDAAYYPDEAHPEEQGGAPARA